MFKQPVSMMKLEVQVKDKTMFKEVHLVGEVAETLLRRVGGGAFQTLQTSGTIGISME